MNPKLAALGQMMAGGGGAPPAEDPTEAPMPTAPENEEQPIPDEGAAVQQALELLSPFAQNPAILQALSILEDSLSGQTGPSGDAPQDMMPMEEEGNLVA